jgi:hypothetical protein
MNSALERHNLIVTIISCRHYAYAFLHCFESATECLPADLPELVLPHHTTQISGEEKHTMDETFLCSTYVGESDHTISESDYTDCINKVIGQ